MDRGDRRRMEVAFPPEDQYGTGRGQSYRPGNTRERSPPPARLGGDSYRGVRSPPRRSDYADSYKAADTYRAPRGRSRSPPPRRDDDRLPLRRDDDRLPPRRDDDRRPPRRDDTYRRRSPSAARFREDRVPRGGDSYRGRPRSPPAPVARREDLPRDDLFRREPVRDERDFRSTRDYRDDRDTRAYVAPAARSPLPRYRDRSPAPSKKAREQSPMSSRGRRSPPPAKRERLASPVRPRYDDFAPSRAASPPRRGFSPEPRDRRGYSPSVRGATRDYRLRSRSPLARNERGLDPRNVNNWRRPAPSPAPRPDYHESAVNSGTTSRRSSPPPIHPSRLSHLPAEQRAPVSRGSPRDPYDTREPYRAPDSDFIPRARNTPPARDAGYELDYGREREVPPPREPRRDDDMQLPVRAPPTGPSGQRGPSSSMAPPTGPSAVMAPSGPRGSAAPPSGPRGAPAVRGDFAPRGRGGFGADFVPRGRGGFGGGFRGGRGGGFGRGGPDAGFGRGGGDPGFGRGGVDAGYGAARTVSEQVFSPPTGPSAASIQPPSGPRSSFSGGQPPAFPRQASATAANPYQRTQRFGSVAGINGNNDTVMTDIPTGPKGARRPTEAIVVTPAANRIHPAIAELPKVIEGGQRAESAFDTSKLKKLEEDAERMRREMREIETRNRKSTRDWDRGQKEMGIAALRSDLAEEALRTLTGESEGQAAF